MRYRPIFPLANTCSPALAPSSETNTRAIFVLAAHKPPYNVYGNPFYNHAGYGNVFSVKPDGGLDKNIQNYEYVPNTGIHGMVFDPTETYLYSADLTANKIWTHIKDPKTGELALVDCLEAPDAGDHPRWVEMHPSGKYLYALMEAGNRLAVYVIDERTHKPVFTHITYPLLPSGGFYGSWNICDRWQWQLTTNLGRASPTQQVPRRCHLLHQGWRIPFRHYSVQPFRCDRLHHCVQARLAWRDRTPALYQPHFDQWWSFKRRQPM